MLFRVTAQDIFIHSFLIHSFIFFSPFYVLIFSNAHKHVLISVEHQKDKCPSFFYRHVPNRYALYEKH